VIRVRVTSTLADLAYGMAAKLEGEGWSISAVVEGDEGFCVAYGKAISGRDLSRIRQAIYPFAPPFRHDGGLEPDAVVVALSPLGESPRVVGYLSGETKAILE